MTSSPTTSLTHSEIQGGGCYHLERGGGGAKKERPCLSSAECNYLSFYPPNLALAQYVNGPPVLGPGKTMAGLPLPRGVSLIWCRQTGNPKHKRNIQKWDETFFSKDGEEDFLARISGDWGASKN
ncbi:hypothetical protein AVEN_175334-1 [Araneus ventricosus]|uniref:Uncharacterized protein n=1 Tax=Araneus ventricosus TaxID=182803 RepID=A0A4Y2H0V7_ARAVE|nr:hypothetical protein AVEN_175334-1 [Araneus ventricosus]